MKFLLTNDDGVDAPGLAALAEAVSGWGEVAIVAPAEHQSGCSHRVTTNGPIRIGTRGPGHYSVEGMPADCVRVGLNSLAPDTTWVLSGINEGGNLGADVFHSGTVAAVREAVLHGWPGIALSQFRRRGVALDWRQAVEWVRPLLRELIGQVAPPGSFWNVNLPHLDAGSPPPEVVFCPLDPSPLPLDFRREGESLHYSGDYHQRRRRPGTDVDVCFRGRIAVTQIALF